MSRRAIIILLPVTLIALLGLMVSGAGAEEAKPALMISSPRHDAGNHWEGETVSHTFAVRNGGAAELRIFNVKPG